MKSIDWSRIAVNAGLAVVAGLSGYLSQMAVAPEYQGSVVAVVVPLAVVGLKVLQKYLESQNAPPTT